MRRWSEFPVVYEDDRSQVRVTLNPSFGVYDDERAWLGNPTAFNPRYDVPQSLAWPEFGLEARRQAASCRRVGAGLRVRRRQHDRVGHAAPRRLLEQEHAGARRDGETLRRAARRPEGRARRLRPLGRAPEVQPQPPPGVRIRAGEHQRRRSRRQLPVAAPGPGPRRQRAASGSGRRYPGVPRTTRTSCPWPIRGRASPASTCATTTTSGSTRR